MSESVRRSVGIRVFEGIEVLDDIVTFAGVSAGIDMALAAVGRFYGRRVADETAECMEYRREPEGATSG